MCKPFATRNTLSLLLSPVRTSADSSAPFSSTEMGANSSKPSPQNLPKAAAPSTERAQIEPPSTESRDIEPAETESDTEPAETESDTKDTEEPSSRERQVGSESQRGESSKDQTAVAGDSSSQNTISRKRKVQMTASTAEYYERANKRLRETLKNQEGQGEGEFQELEDFHIFWSHGASFEVEGKDIDNESCVASLIQSQATGRKYVVAPKGSDTPLPRKVFKKAVRNTTAMLSQLERIAPQVS